jgi:uncharacterized protein YccT (UPF0319 family)
MAKLTIYVSSEEKELFKDFAKNTGKSLSSIIRQLLYWYMKASKEDKDGNKEGTQ